MYTKGEKIIGINIEEEMEKSYIDYAMSVIIGRALPDIRDGLKPVHRRILIAMFREGLLPNKRFSKSAGVVGEVIKKYHPHGDAAVYDSIVRLVQDFSLRYPLAIGQGNFGSIDGDSAAAYRYTEVKMSKIAVELMQDIDKETIDFIPNFDETTDEPVVLPSGLPNLLLNGSSGIAVGMATNIPPHNLNEVVDAIVAKIDNPKLNSTDLLHYVKGPDFPTAGIILGTSGIKQAYTKGKGKITVRARAVIEWKEKGKDRIVISEIPYQVNKSKVMEQIAELVTNKKVQDITDLRDESDRDGMRIVIELKKGAIPKIILNQLFKHTQLQVTYGIILIAIVNNQPRLLKLENIISEFIKHRKEVITRRTKYLLRKAEERAHILEGLKIALDNIDKIIKLIRGSSDKDQAKQGLINDFKLSEIQALAILDMRLHRLTSLERKEIDDEYIEKIKEITKLKNILASERKIYMIIKDELLSMKEKYGDARLTEIVPAEDEISIEDLIADEDMIITISREGYIKRQPVHAYKKQGRGGVGVAGMDVKEEDFVEHLFIASTHNYLLFFTNQGKCYWLKVYDIPQAGRRSRGRAIVNLLNISSEEKISAFISVKEFDKDHYILMSTEQGLIKKTNLMSYSNPRVGGINAIKLDENDRLVSALITDGNQDILLATSFGKSIRFKESDAREMGRVTQGVRGIKLGKGDKVVGMEIVDDKSTLLTLTENGYGKRTILSEYRVQNRGGMGVINIKTEGRNGKVIAIKKVMDDDEIVVITKAGTIIRISVLNLRTIGRNTMGVRIMNLRSNDHVVSVARVISKKEEEEVEDAEYFENGETEENEQNDDIEESEIYPKEDPEDTENRDGFEEEQDSDNENET
ncbi:MAG TPA: DNA gyrase subunit A [Firmicutes bacterium]|nr:DNA gyrase subunit A [Bacillota bacterium]